jgi:Glycosyltransferase family 87
MSMGTSEATADVALEPGLLEPAPAQGVERPAHRRPGVTTARTARAGAIALAGIALCSLAVVVVATGQKTILVPQSWISFPWWLAGPLHPLTSWIAVRSTPTAIGFSVVLALMTIAYLVAVVCAPALDRRTIVAAVVLLHAIWLLVPLMPSTDVFNYLGYARLGVRHGINPYLHGIAAAPHDAVMPLSTWRHLRSPYGPLFTLATYAIAWMPLIVAYWLLKLATVVASLGCVALLARCARQLGHAPQRPMLLYAVNPLVLAYGLGGFHNDVFMLLLTLATISLLLARHEGRAGAAIAAAVAIKASAGILLPFMLLGARRRRRFLAGAAACGAVVLLLSLAAFGATLPNLRDQTSLLSSFSVPNALGQLLGLGGAPPWLLRVAGIGMAGAVALLAYRGWRRRVDWLEGAGWATLALIASLAWLQPWYAMWLLPFAALVGGVRLRRWTLVLCAYVLLTYLPTTGMALQAIHYRPMDSAVGRASITRMHALLLGSPLRQSRRHAALRASGRHHRRKQRRGAHPVRDGRADARADGPQPARS